MKIRFNWVVVLVLIFISASCLSSAQGLLSGVVPEKLHELGEAFSGGLVSLAANGTGSSTGSVVAGSIRNNTPNEIHINVILPGGLYLQNSGPGQNMVATQVFLAGGEYIDAGKTRYISLSPNTETKIIFWAFCADFERDNPAVTETFSIVPMPPAFKPIASKISSFMADNFFDDEIDIPVQLALWRSQGVGRLAIAGKFEFTDFDWEASAVIMNY